MKTFFKSDSVLQLKNNNMWNVGMIVCKANYSEIVCRAERTTLHLKYKKTIIIVNLNEQKEKSETVQIDISKDYNMSCKSYCINM